MSDRAQWLFDLGSLLEKGRSLPDGLIPVKGFKERSDLSTEQFITLEKAQKYQAYAVLFGIGPGGKSIAEAFIYLDEDGDEENFITTYRRLWSWGGVPLVYRQTTGQIRLYSCARDSGIKVDKKGNLTLKPVDLLKKAQLIDESLKNWWDHSMLRNGTLWDDPAVASKLLTNNSSDQYLLKRIRGLHKKLDEGTILKKDLRRKVLILSLLIAYLEARGILTAADFGQHLSGSKKFFEILASGPAFVSLLETLEDRFNGNVFELEEGEKRELRESNRLGAFVNVINAREEANGQLTLWELYSFADIPVEVISHIYQLFVKNKSSSVYTPPFLVRLMLDETMDRKRLDWLEKQNAIILDPSCGSGLFLVEAYKRLVIHWRQKNDWKKPSATVLKELLNKVHGIDLDKGAVELTRFSLCLALCDFLSTPTIRKSKKLFPPLKDKTIHEKCFFEALEENTVKEKIGILVGNPPFESTLRAGAELAAYDDYQREHSRLPDKQLAYLFLHEGMNSVIQNGVLCMLQQYNFLYNQGSEDFRKNFFRTWKTTEILDFISIRGMFRGGEADPKVIAILAVSKPPSKTHTILHATFRRSQRADAKQGFDIDYYDLHRVPQQLATENDAVWRANLLGGGRVLHFVDRLKKYPTLGDYAEKQDWDYGEGFIEGQRGVDRPAEHIVGKNCLPSTALTENGIDERQIYIFPRKPIEGPRSKKRFSPPMILFREQLDIHSALWEKKYLTYKHKLVGFCAPKKDSDKLRKLEYWIRTQKSTLQAYLSSGGVTAFTQRSTWIGFNDIKNLPIPESWDFDLSLNEHLVIDDLVKYLRSHVRLGHRSDTLRKSANDSLPDFNKTFTAQINAIFKDKPLKALRHQSWPGVICQPYVFGDAEVDWNDAEELKDRINGLLHKQRGTSLHITRIARIYDGHAIYLLKPDRLRYWLRSIALRDSDEILADMAGQGF